MNNRVFSAVSIALAVPMNSVATYLLFESHSNQGLNAAFVAFMSSSIWIYLSIMNLVEEKKQCQKKKNETKS